jgi:dihydropteroate synthase
MQCVAHSRSGEQCKNGALPGATVCRMHGGAAPQVKAKAAERLREARDMALAKFVEYVAAGVVDPKTILDASVRLTQLTEVLAGRSSDRYEVEVNDARHKLEDELAAVVAEAERATQG